MSEKPRKLRVFLCHTSADKPKVLELYQRLTMEDWIEPWLDVEKLLLGQHWTSVIKQSLSEADSVIILISNNSINREGFIQREMNYAWDISLEKPRNVIYLIPLRLEDCDVPFDLRERQWGDYFDEKQEKTYTALLKSLRSRYEQKLRIEAEEFSREEKRQQGIELSAREKVEQESTKKPQLEVEEQAKQKAERESAKTAARAKAEKETVEKAQLKTERQAKQQAVKEKVVRELTETKKPLLPNKEPIVETDNMKGFLGFIAIVLVLFIIYIYSGWHTQSISSPPAKPPTSYLLAYSLFPFLQPKIYRQIKEFAKQTAAAQTALIQTFTPIPSFTSTPNDEINPTPVPPGVRPETYTLQNGEFTFCIARRFNVDPDALMNASGVTSPDLYYPGLTLIIPQSGAFPGSRTLASHPTTYSVLSGDETVYSVACKFGDVDPAAIASANGISVSADLTAGQALKIP